MAESIRSRRDTGHDEVAARAGARRPAISDQATRSQRDAEDDQSRCTATGGSPAPSDQAVPPRDEMLAAFTARDGSYDGLFVAGVRTTGIFCRSSCPARKPDPRNVEFFATAGEALAAGYRPCLRCRAARSRRGGSGMAVHAARRTGAQSAAALDRRRLGGRRLAPRGGAALVPAPLRDDLPRLRPCPAAGRGGRQPATGCAGRRRRLRPRATSR